MKRPHARTLLLAAIVLGLLGVGVGLLPPVRSRLEWRLAVWQVELQRRFNPPEEVVFIPSGGEGLDDLLGTEVAGRVTATLGAIQPVSEAVEATATQVPTGIPTETPTPTLTSTPLPPAVQLSGVIHEYEQWNNCGPATLGMQLSYWGWQGNQLTTAAFLKPNPRDKNVSPHELAAYIHGETGLQAIYRPAGTLETLKTLIAAGFPTIVEKTLDVPGVDGWIGHYSLLTGYDDSATRFTAQDSYIQSNLPEPYEKLEAAWRSFNYTFFVIYPPEREAEVMAILGPLADESTAHEIALARAEDEIQRASGLPAFFAWFNKGSSLAGLGRFAEAAAAYDTAFTVYGELPNEARPWRMVWYQFGPYEAYFQTGRYQDVIRLADTTFSTMGEKTVEETYFWRGLAREMTGDLAGARDDLSLAVSLNKNYTQAIEALERLGG